MSYTGTHLPEMFVWWTLGWLAAASVAILLIWGVSALGAWGIDRLRQRKATAKAGYRSEMPPLWPGLDLPVEETAEQLRRRWASTGKKITVSTLLPDDSVSTIQTKGQKAA